MTDQTTAILEVLRWPIAFIILGIVTLIVLRTPLARFIDRTKRARLPGVELDASGDG
jgi:hypothetical protein